MHGDIEFIAPVENAAGKYDLHDFLFRKYRLHLGKKGIINRMGIKCNAFCYRYSHGLTLIQYTTGLRLMLSAFRLFFRHSTAHGGSSDSHSISAVVNLPGLKPHQLMNMRLNLAGAEKSAKHRHNGL